MERPRPNHRLLATCCAVFVALAGSSCTDDGDESADTSATAAAAGVVSSSAPATSAAASSSAVQTTSAASSAPVTSSSPSTAAAPTTDPATTAAPPTTATPTTVAPVTLTLQRDGLAVAAFGTDADATVAAVTAALGAPTEDTGWVDPLTISTCAGTELRRVSWGVLSLLFGDPAGAGARVFFAYSYGDVSGLGGQPAGLVTPEGLGLGTPVVDLRTAYPAVTINAGEEGLVESSFFVDDALAGLLTGATDTDSVTVIFGGPFCG
ncbi:MAG: hypothetical protein M3487_07070 [Actinomycetota bacterium]|nr:hypothetical protein [Actinomycetota bacterium]